MAAECLFYACVFVSSPVTTFSTVAGTSGSFFVFAGVGAAGIAGVGITSLRKPGRKRSMRVNAVDHNNFCLSVLVSGTVGGARKPDECITNKTFFKDSGTASYYTVCASAQYQLYNATQITYQLFRTCPHEPLEQIDDSRQQACHGFLRLA
jgi:hypothetical protein